MKNHKIPKEKALENLPGHRKSFFKNIHGNSIELSHTLRIALQYHNAKETYHVN